jgi:Bor protein
MKLYYKLIVGSFLLMLIVGQGCYTLNQVGSPVSEAIEITNNQNATPISHFTRTKTVNHFVYGLVSPDDAGIEKIVADAVKQGNGTRAVNVRLKYQQTFINGLVGGLTFGIYTPFTLTVEGDVVK